MARSPPSVALLQFLRFGIVGVGGLVVDTAVVYALRGSFGLYGAGLVSYVAAATVTWAGNRAWTFAGASVMPAWRQWAAFMLANLFGFVLNRGTYATLVATSATVRTWPVLAVAAGAVAGMLVNFNLSRRLVFR